MFLFVLQRTGVAGWTRYYKIFHHTNLYMN